MSRVHSASSKLHTQPGSDQAVLTVEKIMQCIRDLPPPPPKATFASCKLFSDRHAMRFIGDDQEEFSVAHPDFWKSALLVETVSEFKCTPFWPTVGGIPVVNIDVDLTERARVMEQLMKVMSKASDKQVGTQSQSDGVNP